MKLLDLTLPSPAENLACDEALLDACEESGGDEILRFWEARETFVVVGYANKVATEVNLDACAAQESSNFSTLLRRRHRSARPGLPELCAHLANHR